MNISRIYEIYKYMFRGPCINCKLHYMGHGILSFDSSRLSDPSPIKEYQWLVISAGAMHAVARQMYFWRKGGVVVIPVVTC